RLAGRFGAEDLDDAPPGQPADAERPVNGERAGRDRGDLDRLAAPHLHDGALAELLLDLRDGDIDRPRLLTFVLNHVAPRSGVSGSGGNRGSTVGDHVRPAPWRKSSESRPIGPSLRTFLTQFEFAPTISLWRPATAAGPERAIATKWGRIPKRFTTGQADTGS